MVLYCKKCFIEHNVPDDRPPVYGPPTCGCGTILVDETTYKNMCSEINKADSFQLRYTIGTCAYSCARVISLNPGLTIKRSSVKQLLKKYYCDSTISNALIRLEKDGIIARESVNVLNETIYRRAI